MTVVLWSSHFETELYSLYWEGLAGAAEQWAVILRLLPALAEQEESLGQVSGDLQVVIDRPDGRAHEDWPVTTDAGRLQAVLSARSDAPQPVELPLQIAPLLWLPDDTLDLVDFDLSDDDVIARAELLPVEELVHDHQGLKAWRLPKQPVEMLTFRLLFGFDEVPTSVRLAVSTRCDLWRRTQPSGEPGASYHLANAAQLQRSVEEIARRTAAAIAQRPPP
ncbi:MAG: hypothetical protein ACREBE_02080 [bacterium]